MNHLEELLRKNAPKPPPAPRNELEMLLNRIESAESTPTKTKTAQTAIPHWFAAAAAGILLVLGIPVLQSTKLIKTDLQQQGTSGEDTSELVSFATDVYVETLEQASLSGDEIEI